MPVAQIGDRVTIHYIGTLDTGRIFDSADEENPLSFIIGKGAIFSALEEAVTGMEVGMANNIEIPAEQAYGPHRKENLLQVSRQQCPAERELRIGEKVSMTFADGEERIMLVVNCDADAVTLDGNHPLAGLDLTIALKLVSIDEKNTAEV
ncbi:MAG: FKBP-type peptidyl-prolyl cis-trans isomerase [Desulfuromusa sp.]|nr:FKBP-type peptidyl-prolyl cis-trans isomerase [Desulfuromusa sp.]